MTNQTYSKLAVAVWMLVVALGAYMWYLQPERAPFWAAAMFVVPVIWGGMMLLKRTRAHKGMSETDKGRVSRAVVGAGLILAAALGLALAETRDLIDGGISERVMGMLVGAILVIMGNNIPKTLEPLSAQRCDPAKKQSLQRFAGWTFVLAGLAYAVVWLVLPVDTADWVSTLVAAASVLMVASRLAWVLLRRTRTQPRTGTEP